VNRDDSASAGGVERRSIGGGFDGATPLSCAPGKCKRQVSHVFKGREWGAPSKGADFRRVRIPPERRLAPAGRDRSGGGGGEAVEAFETKGRFGGSASRQAATRVNAVQASKQPNVGAARVARRARPSPIGYEG
jgi:hypothetical protein